MRRGAGGNEPVFRSGPAPLSRPPRRLGSGRTGALTACASTRKLFCTTRRGNRAPLSLPAWPQDGPQTPRLCGGASRRRQPKLSQRPVRRGRHALQSRAADAAGARCDPGPSFFCQACFSLPSPPTPATQIGSGPAAWGFLSPRPADPPDPPTTRPFLPPPPPLASYEKLPWPFRL